MPPRPVVLTSPQCGGTHALIGLLKSLGLTLACRHRDGLWYPGGADKPSIGTPITQESPLPLSDGDFATGHSGPFPTAASVLCNLRDPRDIMICAWKRRYGHYRLSRWLNTRSALRRARGIPQYWDWCGDRVLRVWYEDIRDEDNQRRIAAFCGVPWQPTSFYGRGKTWSGNPSHWEDHFDNECAEAWDRLWERLTAQSWAEWWRENGRDDI